MKNKKEIVIIMGSKSDMPIMQHGIDILDKFGLGPDVKVLSAHRTPSQTIKFAAAARKRGYKVIIAAAGGAAHLAGVVAAHTTLPVVGVPIETKALGGVDSLFSTVQMPSGIPVGCMAIGKAGAVNAAIFAVEILATKNKLLEKKLASHKKELAKKVLKG
ncbi:MAG: 5-(carboxyamino)imidazole ribonucleotide mutase [Candidatus Omnitrophica bacterium]|nr:5-(carboxyamino)imidazole ribonucleotide mutase [Candidatus Omnitrophota bacterium]